MTSTPTRKQRPDLYECKDCGTKGGSPSLCARCLKARETAGDAWVGPWYSDPEAPRQLTQEEVQERFMQQLAHYVHYWANVKDPHFASVEQRLSALAFGFLNMLDGTTMGLPSFEVVPSPHPSDKEYHQNEGMNWWPPSPLPADAITVHGSSMLHELWNKYDPFQTKAAGD